MDLKQKIQKDLVEASKQKNEATRTVLRSLLAEVKTQEIENKNELSDEDTQKIVGQEIKKRKEAIEQYGNAGRDELVEKEKVELGILENYAPEQVPEDELNNIINDIIKETDASGMQDMGMVMKEAMKRVQGKADGSVVSDIVKKKLQQNG